MRFEDRRQYRKLKRFVNRLGIKSADEGAESVIGDLLDALEVGMYTGGKPDQLHVSADFFSGLSKMFEKKDK